MKLLPEEKFLKQGFLPKDLNGAATTGLRVKLEKAHRLAIVLTLGDSTAAQVRATLRQHDAATGGTSKDLEIDMPYYVKADTATVFTKVVPTVKAALYNLDSHFANAEGIVVFIVNPEDLDVNGNFTHVSVDLANATAAKVAACVYVLDADIVPAYGISI